MSQSDSTPGRPRIPSDTILDDLRAVAADVGRSPTMDEYNELGEVSAQTVKNRFGSWNEAKREAGLKPNPQGSKQTVTDEAYLADVCRVADIVDGGLTVTNYRELGRFSPDVGMDRFGSWNETLVQAGVPPLAWSDSHDVESTIVHCYKPQKRKLKQARDIMEERHDHRIPLHLALTHLAELYIDTYGEGAEA